MDQNQKPKDYVIVAENYPPNRTVLILIMRKLGFEVIECESVDSVEEALSQSKENIVAVFASLKVLGGGGLELLKRIRRNQKFTTLPFLLMPSVADMDYLSEAKRYKVTGILTAPTNYQAAVKKIQEIFPDRKLPIAS